MSTAVSTVGTTQHMRLVEQLVGQAFVRDGLACHILSVDQGPHHLLYSIKLYEPTAANLSKALRLAPAIEAAINDGPVRVTLDAGVVLIETPSPWPIIIEAQHLRGQRLAVPVGLTARREVVGIDFAEHPHAMFLGPSGRGKSSTARSIIYQLMRQNPCSDVAILIMAFKVADWESFVGIPHVLGLAITPNEIGAALAWLRNEVLRRTRERITLPHVFCVVDDVLNVASMVDDAGDMLGQVASLGRGVGCHLLLGSQRLGKRGIGDVAVSSNVTVRAIFGSVDGQDSAAFGGQAGLGAERIGRHKGDALLVVDGNATRVATSLLLDHHLDELPRYEPTPAPWVVGGGGVRVASESPTQEPLPPVESPTLPPTTRKKTRRSAPQSDNERQRIREAYARLGSKSKVAVELYGYKDVRTFGLVSRALEEEPS